MSSNINIQRICQHCGNEFTARTTVTRYCGDQCAKRAYKVRKREEKIVKSNQETHEIKSQPTENLMNKELLSVREVSMLIGCSLKTTYRLIEKGQLKAINLSERLTRVKRSEIEKILGK